MRGGEVADRRFFSSFLASKSYQNIKFDQIKDMDINLVIIYLIFYQNWNFLATHVDARSQKWWFFTFFGRKQPMRRELANSRLKAKIQIKQIGGFTKSLSEYGRVWTWIAYILKLIPNMNLKISISKIFENFIFFFSLFHTVHLHACAVERQQSRRFFMFVCDVENIKGVLHLWALFLKILCIFSKNKATLDNGSGQKYSKELKNHSFTSVETIVVKLQWKMCENQYFPCFEP